jgi:hypothetical protein
MQVGDQIIGAWEVETHQRLAWFVNHLVGLGCGSIMRWRLDNSIFLGCITRLPCKPWMFATKPIISYNQPHYYTCRWEQPLIDTFQIKIVGMLHVKHMHGIDVPN